MRLLVIMPSAYDLMDHERHERTTRFAQMLGQYFEMDLFCSSIKPINADTQQQFEKTCKRTCFEAGTKPLDSLKKFAAEAKTTYDRILITDLVFWPYVEAIFPGHTGIVVDRNQVEWRVKTEAHTIIPTLGDIKHLWKLRKLEQRTYYNAALEVVGSEQDRAFLEKKLGKTDKVFVLPNGVDTQYFDADSIPPSPADTPIAIFCGTCNDAATIDALFWYARAIHPQVLKRYPNFKIQIIGLSLSPEIQSLMRKSPGWEWVGPVKDLRPYYQQAWFQFVPFRTSAPIDSKITESLAMGLPVVSTTVGAQGLGLQSDHEVLIADTAVDFTEAMARYISEPETRMAHGSAGRLKIQQAYTWHAQAKVLAEVIRTLKTPTAPISFMHATCEPQLVMLLGLPFHNLNLEEAAIECDRAIQARNPVYFVTPNVDFATLAFRDEDLRQILFHAKRVLCDGQPLVWLSKLFGCPLKERVAGADLVPKLLELCTNKSYRVFFFGSDYEALQAAKDKLIKKLPNLQIAGILAPSIDEVHTWDNEAIVKSIRNAHPDVLLIALGCPKQERWAYSYFQETQVPLSLGIGASLDFIAGKQKRAPLVFRQLGFEWFWRMMMDPRRLVKRYAMDAVFLGWASLKQVIGSHGTTASKTNSLAYTASAQKASHPTIGYNEHNYTKLVWSGSIEMAHLNDLPWPRDFAHSVILDAQDVSFIDSAGLGALAKLMRSCRAAGSKLALAQPSKTLTSAIQSIRLDRQLHILGSIEQAVDFLTRSETNACMLVEKEAVSGKWTLTPQTTITIEHEQSLDNTWKEWLSQPHKNLSVNVCLKNVSFLDSRGAALLLRWRKDIMAKEGQLSLSNPTDSVDKTLHMLKLDTLFNIVTTHTAMKKILLSAGMIQSGQSGVGQYVIELAKELHRRPDIRFIVAGLERDREWFSFIKDDYWQNIPSAYSDGIASLYWHEFKLPKIIKNLAVDLVHIPSYRRILWNSPVPQVATIHDCAPFRMGNKYDWMRIHFGKKMVPWLARKSDKIIAVSNTTAQDVHTFMKVPKEKIVTILNGVDHVRFCPPRPDRLRAFLDNRYQSAPYFIYVARFEHPGKNHVRLIEAFNQFKAKTGHKAQLVLAGAAWRGARAIDDAIESSPYKKDIRVLGFVHGEELPLWYAGSIGLVFPSLVEGFGLAVVEAQACGTLVASSNTTSLTEVAGPSTLLFDPSNIDSIALSLERLASISSHERQALIAESLEWASQFNWSRVGAQVLEVYNELLKADQTPQTERNLDALKKMTESEQALNTHNSFDH